MNPVGTYLRVWTFRLTPTTRLVKVIRRWRMQNGKGQQLDFAALTVRDSWNSGAMRFLECHSDELAGQLIMVTIDGTTRPWWTRVALVDDSAVAPKAEILWDSRLRYKTWASTSSRGVDRKQPATL